MVVTVFGDVHGNIVALEKLFKLEKSETDLFVSHGDIVNYAPWSNECVQFLNSQSNCHLLKGNHEEFFIKGSYGGTNLIASTFFEKCFDDFDESSLAIINEYDEKLVFDDFIVQHTINNQYIFSDTIIDEFDNENNYIIGHSHQQFYRTIKDKKLYNTGSLGQNRQYINQSCYLKVNLITKNVQLKSFIHDIDIVIKEMKARNYPELCLNYYNSKQKVML